MKNRFFAHFSNKRNVRNNRFWTFVIHTYTHNFSMVLAAVSFPIYCCTLICLPISLFSDGFTHVLELRIIFHNGMLKILVWPSEILENIMQTTSAFILNHSPSALWSLSKFASDKNNEYKLYTSYFEKPELVLIGFKHRFLGPICLFTFSYLPCCYCMKRGILRLFYFMIWLCLLPYLEANPCRKTDHIWFEQHAIFQFSCKVRFDETCFSIGQFG